MSWSAAFGWVQQHTGPRAAAAAMSGAALAGLIWCGVGTRAGADTIPVVAPLAPLPPTQPAPPAEPAEQQPDVMMDELLSRGDGRAMPSVLSRAWEADAIDPGDVATDAPRQLPPNDYIAIAHVPSPTAVTGGFALLLGIGVFRHYMRYRR